MIKRLVKKPWFKGWGKGEFPVTKQGWLLIVIWLAIFYFATVMNFPPLIIKLIFLVCAVIAFLTSDILGFE